MRAENAHDKEYVVAVDHQITEDFITKMGAGVRLSDATTRKCRVTWMGPRVFKIILQQGLNRQIRRMCSAFGYEVIALQRVRIMHIRLDKLPVGKWRNLTQQEIDGLMGGPRSKPAPRPSAAARRPNRPVARSPARRPAAPDRARPRLKRQASTRPAL